jgi:hypothetical protein
MEDGVQMRSNVYISGQQAAGIAAAIQVGEAGALAA